MGGGALFTYLTVEGHHRGYHPAGNGQQNEVH